MSNPRSSRACRAMGSLAAIAFFAVPAAINAQATTPPPDANLFTTYTMGVNYKSIEWVVCGSTEESEGCFGSGTIGPFGEAGAMIEGEPSVEGLNVFRHIYVVDVAAGASGNDVELYVYRKTDSISATYDTVTVRLINSAALSLVGGAKAKAFIAANEHYLYVGTNFSDVALQIHKSDLSATQVGGFSPPVKVSAITTDGYGNVTITFGDFTSGASGSFVYAADGGSLEDGGGANFMLNTVTGVSTSTLPTSDASVQAARPGVHAKPAQQ